MAETRRFALPLLASAQAQKHVTVNEALLRLDALASGAAVSRATTPPPAPIDGDVHVVAAGAGGAWAGREGQLALFENGDWAFIAPHAGARIWVRDEGVEFVHDGDAWAPMRAAAFGAAPFLSVASIDHVLAAGATSTTAAIIPDKAVVIGVTARVLATLTGPGLTAWRLGAPGAPGRYGAGYGTAAGAFAHGVTSAPLAYFGETGLLLEAEAGAFESGVVRLCVHFIALGVPEAL